MPVNVSVLLLAFLLPLSSVAQFGRSGSVAGAVIASGGAPISAATVTVRGDDGSQRTRTTGLDGAFSFLELPSGTYTADASADGFTKATQAGVAVAVGRTTQLVFRMTLAGAQESITVNAGAQVAFDTTQTSSVVNIDRDRVEELPIPNRNYLSFVQLSPQAVPANPVLSQQTQAQSGGGFGFGGLRPSSNAVRLDGLSDDDEFTGGSRTQLSPEAISDFQIVNHGFQAESGGAAGGAIDVQTRVGLERIHGDAFLFEQNGALNGTPPLGLFPSKPEENRFRAGLALGGTLQPKKTFYYVAAEQEVAHGEDANDLGAVTLNQIDLALGQPGPAQGILVTSGFFPTGGQETELSARVDRVFSATQSAMLRYAFTNSRAVADAFNTDELSDRTARGSAFAADQSLNGTWSAGLANGLLNKLNAEMAQRRALERTGATSGPGILIPGVAQFGTPFAGNSRRFETSLQIGDSAMLQREHHLLQAGAGVERVGLRSQAADGARGLFVFSSLDALTSAAPDFFTQTYYANPNSNFSEYRASAFIQDHWTYTANLTFDFGLRYEDNHLPASLPQHALNLSPRAGVAWTPRKSLVVRGGFGVFYDRFLLSTINRLLLLDGVDGFEQVVEDAAATALYRGGSVPARPLAGVAPSVWTAQPGLHNPYSEVASLSMEQALPLQATLKVEYQFVHGVHLGRTTNVNLLPPVVLTAQNGAGLGISVATQQQLGSVVFSPARLDPAHDAVNQFATSAGSLYHGGTVTLNRQFTDDVQLLAGYTYSKTVDDASFDNEQPQNPYALRAERGPSLQDQTHRLTLSGLWLIGPDLNDPQDAAANAHPGALMRLVTGLEFAPILSIGSGFRDNPLTGLDSNREHVYPFAARPAGSGRNSLRTTGTLDFDLRVLKMIPLGTGHLDVVAESFNLLNHRNVSLWNGVFGSGNAADPGFNHAIGTSNARQVQFSLDFEF